jgi:hypothetical protein
MTCCLLQGLNWGNGFVTDKALIDEWQITDANPFFQALMERPYLERVVISPHLYGPSVSHRKDFYKVRRQAPAGSGTATSTDTYPCQPLVLAVPSSAEQHRIVSH